MDKSFHVDLPQSPQQFIEEEPNGSNSQGRLLQNIILRRDQEESSRPRAFTPTRKATSFRNDFIATSSQQRIPQQTQFQKEERGKRLELYDNITSRITQLQSRVNRLERKQARIIKSRRIRRKSSEIAKLYSCHEEGCKKHYGTETALKKHMQLKHKEEAKKECLREQEAIPQKTL